jgi:hypothetical protein
MNVIFREYLDKFVIVFLDDIIIYSKYEAKYEKHLRMVLQVLREHHLHAKLSKCSFLHRHIHYLGHIISEEGLAMDLVKIKSNEEWSTPINVVEVRSFMGLIGYCRIFIEGFS